MSDIIGHAQVLSFFAKVKQAGNLSHAYCLVGPEQVGKKRVVEELAIDLLKTERAKLAINGDYTLVEQLFDEKTEKTKKDITVAQIRELREYLARHSYYGGYKIAVIDNAEKMNAEASNAFLKTLEEPTDKTILFIITRDETQLPTTITSRCQIIYFQPVKSALLKSYLKDKVDEATAETMTRLSQGLPGKIITWLDDRTEFEWQKQEVLRFQSLLGKPFYQKIKKVDDLFNDKTDHIAVRQRLQRVLSLWQILVRDFFLCQAGLVNFNIHHLEGREVWNAKITSQLEKHIQEAKIMLEKNIHSKLLIENILLNLP